MFSNEAESHYLQDLKLFNGKLQSLIHDEAVPYLESPIGSKSKHFKQQILMLSESIDKTITQIAELHSINDLVLRNYFNRIAN